MLLVCVAKQSARHKASAVCSERAGLMASADGLRRGKLSSAGAQLVWPHRCTGWRCRALHPQEGVSTAWICRKNKPAPTSAYLEVWPQLRSAHLCASTKQDRTANLLSEDL